MLKINEIFYSIQGESSFSGLPCLFIRLTGCNLRCSWCDTEYAFHEGKSFSIDDILEQLKNLAPICSLVEVTGGEPLLQAKTPELVDKLIENGYNVLVETGGSLDISSISEKAVRIIDIKCPSSNMHEKMDFKNLNKLTVKDEIKFVIADSADFKWASDIIQKYSLDQKHTVLISPVFKSMPLEELAEAVKNSRLNLKFQLQLHKYIWEPETIGV